MGRYFINSVYCTSKVYARGDRSNTGKGALFYWTVFLPQLDDLKYGRKAFPSTNTEDATSLNGHQIVRTQYKMVYKTVVSDCIKSDGYYIFCCFFQFREEDWGQRPSA